MLVSEYAGYKIYCDTSPEMKIEEIIDCLDNVEPPKDWPSFIGNVSEEWLEEINGKA